MLPDKIQLNFNLKLGTGISIILLIVIFSFYSIILSWGIHCQNPDLLITIPKGSSAQSVARLLKEESCFDSENIFKIALTITMNNKRIRTGRYNLKGISSIGQLVNVLTSQSHDRVKVTLIEGWTLEQYAQELKSSLELDNHKFLRLCRDYNFTHSLGIEAPSLEGFLFPDTYILLKTYTEGDVIRVMVNQFKHHMRALKELTTVNLNMREIVTMASIIQGEAMYEDEMKVISSVYHNRLKKRMLLQADPTIQYIVPGKPRRLYNKDLEIDDPYNTYKYKGLPPGPINNPGLDALNAAANPATTDYLYFVSNLEGRHTFTKTSNEHNKAKQIMKQKRRLKKRKI